MAEVAKVKEVVEKPKGFTKMRNISGNTLQLTCGAVAPKEEVPLNEAELSTLHMFLEGVK